MKFLSWNINQRSEGNRPIPKLVFDEIETCNSDILILTEYVKTVNHNDFCDFLNKLGYRVFTRNGEYLSVNEQLNSSMSNEILIAIKDSINFKFELNMMPETEEYPNFLDVNIITKEFKDIHIIGVRVKIGSASGKLTSDERTKFLIKDSKERMEQIVKVTDYLENIDGEICVAGDFNNFYYNSSSEVDSWVHDLKYLQNYYSYPLLVQQFSKTSLTNYTPDGKLNEVYSWLNKHIKSEKRYIRNDHIFSNIDVKNPRYDWGFIESENYKGKVGYPDHAMLIADIDF